MTNIISLVDVHLPAFLLPTEEKRLVEHKLAEWQASNFAGYHRILQPGSDCAPDLKKIQEIVGHHRSGGTGRTIRDFVVLGTGGSSLGAEAIVRALKPSGDAPRFHIADNNDPQWFQWLLHSLDPEETLFYVVSKSGKTPETLSQFLVALEWMKGVVSQDWKKHFVLCTDPTAGDLRQLARLWKLDCLDVPPAVGGRFSALTPVGLFPAAFAGLDCEAMLEGARAIAAWESQENPCALLASSLVKNLRQHPITVLMPYSSQLQAFSRWFAQLWAESLGKEGKGFTPYPATGTTDQHSQVQLYMEGPRDKVILFTRIKQFTYELPLHLEPELLELPSFRELHGHSMFGLFESEYLATRDALTKQGVPNATIEVETLNETSLGALFYFWESVTAIAGALLQVNPFDQPGVEAGKLLTKQYLKERKK